MEWLLSYVHVEFVYLYICDISLCFRQGSKVEQFHWLFIPCLNISQIKILIVKLHFVDETKLVIETEVTYISGIWRSVGTIYD